MDRQDNFERRRDILGDIPPLVDWAESEVRGDAATRRAPSSVLNLLIILMFLPEKIVPIVEGTVGWPDLHFGHREGNQVLQMSPGNFTPLRRAVEALRDIRGQKLTPEIVYFMQNLQEYKTLLGSLLADLKFSREMRFPRGAQPTLNLLTRDPNDVPEPIPGDLTTHADALEVLLNELDAEDHVVIRLAQLDLHIVSVHQLIEFLR